MQLIIIGKAPIKLLKELNIVSQNLVDNGVDLNYASGLLQTRTASAEQAVLTILGFNAANSSSYWLEDSLFTETNLNSLQTILDVAGEPEHINTIKLLKGAGAFIAFIDLLT